MPVKSVSSNKTAPAKTRKPSTSKKASPTNTKSSTDKVQATGKSRTTPKRLPEISPEQRRQMIAEAAYYLAEQRGFNGGNPELDWFRAEQQIENLLSL